MKDPREALDAARRAASHRSGDTARLDAIEPGSSTLDSRRLMDWAIIEPERAKVYSTRRYGRPITVFKRLLVRLLRQYLDEVSAQQSRFNAQVAAHVMRIEERLTALEHERERPPAGPGR